MQDNSADFQTNTFRYRLTRSRAISYFWKTNWFGIGMFTMSFFPLIMLMHQHQPFTAVFLFILFFVFWLKPFLFFKQYYNYANDKILYLSEEEDVFKYGTINDLFSYSKNNIENVTLYAYHQSWVNSYSGFSYLLIIMNDGTPIYIPNIIIDDKKLLEVFNEFNIENINEIPRLPL